MRICENRIVFASKQQGQERAAMERDFRLQKRSTCPRIVLHRAEKAYRFAPKSVGNGLVSIGINVSRLSGQRLGAGRHVEYMLNSFEITKPLVDNEFSAVWPNYIRSAIKLCSLFKISHEKQNRRAGVPELSRLP
jgi:hypothetical protein